MPLGSEGGSHRAHQGQLKRVRNEGNLKLTETTGQNGGTRWRSRLSHCATSRKVAGSIPDGVIGIFFIYIILPTALWPW